jgi:hypothetical protein
MRREPTRVSRLVGNPIPFVFVFELVRLFLISGVV